MTLLKFLDETYWTEHALTLKRSSLEQIRCSVRLFSRYLKREADLNDLERATVIGFLAERSRTVSAATVNKDRRSLLCLWRCAAELELLHWPRKIPKAKEPHRVPHTFTHDQIHRLIDAAAHCETAAWWRSLLLMLYDTGARLSAALSVQIRDVDIEHQYIRLRAECSKTNTEQVLAIGKDTATAIAAQCLARDASEPVWPWPHHHRRLFVHFRRLAEKAGVPLPPRKAFHSLRRTVATLLASDLGIESASRQLGHSSVAVTRRYVDQSRITPLHWLPPRP